MPGLMIAPAITVLLVDDHAVVREGYRRLLERSGDITVTGETADAAEALELHVRLAPGVTVLDVSLRGSSGIEVARRILGTSPDARILMFSMHEDAVYVRRALAAGAQGYLSKSGAPDALVEAVRRVAAGERYVDPAIERTLERENRVADDVGPDALSPREFEVLRLLVRGASVRDIADQLGITPKTVANQQTLIRQKLGAETPVQLLRAAARLGLGERD
jgi:DNA-binding NarL/FixJ family response regulator